MAVVWAGPRRTAGRLVPVRVGTRRPVSVVGSCLGFSLHGGSALPTGPTTARSPSLHSCWTSAYSEWVPPVLEQSFLITWCLDCFEHHQIVFWSHLNDTGLDEVTLCCHYFISIVVRNKAQPLWKVKGDDVEGVGIPVGSRDCNRGNRERKRTKFPGKKINRKEEQERKKYVKP